MKLTYISKEQSLMLKGFALIVMVLCHLFRQQNLTGAFSLCNVQGVPLASWMSGAISPVGLYLFVSGYGLYYTRKSHRGGVLRIMKLYKLYWLTLLVFLPIACWLKPESYPGGWMEIAENLTAFRTTWNGEIWFLFPYMLLALSCQWTFALLDRVGCRKMLITCGVLFYISLILIKLYREPFFYHHYASYHVAIYFECMLMFVVGAAFCKSAYRESNSGILARLLSLPQWALIGMFLGVYLLACATPHTFVFGPFFQSALILLFIHINWRGIAKSGFCLLGRYSTVVWFIHTWICYYCFKELIYGSHYPVVMLAVTFATSLGIGYVIQKVDRWTSQVMRLEEKRK